MAMHRCHQEYAEEFEILVCWDDEIAAPLHATFYSRLRFRLLASSWLPSPLGIFLWSALHVMLLIVGGPVFWVLQLLTAFIFYVVYLCGLTAIFMCGLSVVYGLVVVAFDLIRVFVRSIRFSWSLVGFLVCHEPIVEWRGQDWWTILFVRTLKAVLTELFSAFVPIGVPCMGGSLYQETKDRKSRTWALWCEEVVRMHDAIAL